MRLVTCLGMFLLFPVAVFTQQRSKVPTVDVEIVGTPSGYISVVPAAINNHGHVVGSAQRGAPTFESDAFFWSPETGFVIIALNVVATDINERGDVTVAGFDCSDLDTACGYIGSVWNRGTWVSQLGNIYPTAINNRGDVAGACRDGWIQEYMTACAIRHGVFEEWGCPKDDQYQYCDQWATGINEKGDVIGARYLEDDRGAALFFPHGGGEVVLGLGAAWDINNRGTVVGFIHTFDKPSWFEISASWTKGARQELYLTRYSSAAGGRAVAVNARGWAIGSEYDLSGGAKRSVLWTTADASPIDLTMKEYSYTGVFDLNDGGQIVGTVGENSVFPNTSKLVILNVKP